MAKKKHWMAEAFGNAHGQLRKKAKAKKGKPIPAKKLESMTHSKNLKTKRQAVAAQNARKAKKK